MPPGFESPLDVPPADGAHDEGSEAFPPPLSPPHRTFILPSVDPIISSLTPFAGAWGWHTHGGVSHVSTLLAIRPRYNWHPRMRR